MQIPAGANRMHRKFAEIPRKFFGKARKLSTRFTSANTRNSLRADTGKTEEREIRPTLPRSLRLSPHPNRKRATLKADVFREPLMANMRRNVDYMKRTIDSAVNAAATAKTRADNFPITPVLSAEGVAAFKLTYLSENF